MRPQTALFLLVLMLLAPACEELELLAHGSSGGPGPPPSRSLSVSFIDVGQGDGVLVQAGGESYLISEKCAVRETATRQMRYTATWAKLYWLRNGAEV